MFGLGTTELIIIGVIVFLIFGAKRIPEIGKGLGGAIREFKKVKKEISTEEDADRKKDSGDRDTSGVLEKKLAEKVLEEVPGVKTAMDAKKKVDKVKELIKS